jgi:hypothetical protein
MFKWPATKDAKKTSTIATHEYYDYPSQWRPDSLWKVRIDGKDMGSPLAERDYYFEQENNFPNGSKNIWFNQKKRFFVTVNGLPPATTGDNNIEMWGFKFVDKLVNASDITIFSYDMPEVNEAIVLEALAICRIKGGEQPVRLARYVQGAVLISYEAQDILQTAWAKILQEQSKIDRTTNEFTVTDFFATGINRVNTKRYNIGNF